MRLKVAVLAAGGLAVVLMTPGIAPAGPGDAGLDPDDRKALSLGLQTAAKAGADGNAPTGANPYLALLPDPSKADYATWRSWLTATGERRAARQAQQRGQQRGQQRAAAPAPLLVDEDEPSGTSGSNDNPAAAQLVQGFGTAAGSNRRARVLGTLSPERVRLSTVAPNVEDDGAIPLARDTGISTIRRGIATSGQIGDGPHGRAGDGTGDFDFYKVTATAGEVLTVDIDTPTGPLDSMVLLYNEAGAVVATNDDAGGVDSLLNHQIATTGTYYVMITGFRALPNDPFVSGSGTGAGSEGPYDVRITVAQPDVDFFAVRLRKGDIIGASVKEAAGRITIFDTVPREVHGSDQDPSGVYPADTPLPAGGNAVTDYVAETAGWHYIGVSDGDGGYDITVELYRSVLEGKKQPQTLFLDFDGARLNTSIFGGPGVRTLSPMRAFLAKWGLTRADENALINAIVARVRENVRQDLIDSGLNGQFDIRILNSRDHADPFGQANVSRVVIGGTVAESGVNTIGIAQSIDPGNFDTTESALVLLDLLSAPAGDDASLNTYLAGAGDRIRFVGQALGNVVSHEAGHLFGNYHVDQFNANANLMDQGGNFPLLFGVGPDGVGGTADDPDVDFGEDVFNPNEGFTGIEDTLSRIVFPLTR